MSLWKLARLGQRLSQTSVVSLSTTSSGNKEHRDVDGKEAIRNVGIMAHIDAGKTTTTERMLFYAGCTRRLGDVDDGDTVTDFLKQERERGITIQSASVSFDWLDHCINLIDTPGHVDFMFEVERCLRVLDGAVAIFDASAGVETQTLSVWKQANRYNIPRIAFVNKMDKAQVSLLRTVNSVTDKLRTVPLVTQVPVGRGKDFAGVVDLVSMELLLWERGNDGSVFLRHPLERGTGLEGECLESFFEQNTSLSVGRSLLEEVYNGRQALVDQLAMLDNQLLEMVLTDSFQPLALDSRVLKHSIRSVTLSCQAVPLFCGSSLKNKCVQPLMDAIVSYLPSPSNSQIVIPNALKDLVAFAFKVSHDPRRGPIVFLRVYSGSLQPNRTVYNISKKKEERISRLLLMMAGEHREVSLMTAGSIVAVVGLKHTVTGDTIVHSKGAAVAAHQHEDKGPRLSTSLAVSGMVVPEPMFFCTIEPFSASQQKDLDHALSCLAREDPSLRVSVDEDTNQTVLSGMGELHLEIVLDRIKREYNVEASTGELQVAYREVPTRTVTHEESLQRTVGGQCQTVSVGLTVSRCSVSTGERVHVHFNDDGKYHFPAGFPKEEVFKAVQNGAEMAAMRGPLLCFPLTDTKMSVNSFSISSDRSLVLLSSCTTDCVAKALHQAEVELLEPFAELLVTVPAHFVDIVLSDLTNFRRGLVKEVLTSEGQDQQISGFIPVASLMGYSTSLRTMTSGTASFSINVSHYQPVAKSLEEEIKLRMRGY